MVFQDPYSSLNPRRRDRRPDRRRRSTILGLVASRGSGRARVAELLDQVGLPADAADRFPHEFSGGQRQRIAIARALAAEPSVIVLDEPLSSLDASAQAQIANLLVGLARELELGLLLISHDLAIVRQVADACRVMYLGKIVESGPTGEALEPSRCTRTREALIGAVPQADGTGTLPEALPGEVPDPAQPADRLPLPPALPATCSTAAASTSRRWSRSPGASRPAGSTSPARRSSR